MSRLLSVFALVAMLASPLAAASAATTPALSAFEEAFSKVNDYTVSMKAREVQGGDVQNRTYAYWFKKPNKAKIEIVDGDGRGSGGVWVGGDRVSGHQGGFLSRFHLKVDLHDRRAVSLRGYTIPDGLFQNEIAQYTGARGKLVQKSSGDSDEVDLDLASPISSGPNQGVTKMAIWLSKSTHMPLKQIRWSGDKIVTEETWSGLRTNVGLGDGEFPF